MPPELSGRDRFIEQVAQRVAERIVAAQHNLLHREQLAERMGVSLRVIGSMVQRGEIPPPLLNTPGSVRWDWDQVKEWLRSKQGRQRRKGRGKK